jgi:hypothetical protein
VSAVHDSSSPHPSPTLAAGHGVGHDGPAAHDAHAGHDAHGGEDEPLGPIDVAAWGAALLGAGLGALAVIALWVAISA